MSTELAVAEDTTLTESISTNTTLQSLQEKFLDSTLGKLINNAVDIGIRAVCPDLIEDEVINVKDAILESGFSSGIKEAISSVVNLGKSALGIVTGNFENVSQIQTAVKSGGIIDTVSNLLDKAVSKAEEKGLINSSVASLIKSGKNTILDTVSDSIENELSSQVKSVEKLQSYCDKWNEYYEAQDFDKMESAYKNIEKYLKQTVPLENTINEARKIENLHNLIKNNGQNFDISSEEMALAETL